MASATYYQLPETIGDWPWPRRIHPHAEEVQAASAAWFRAFCAFSPETQRAFETHNVALAAALIYPFSSKELPRVGCDLFHLYFVTDHYTNTEGAAGCRALVDVVIDALRHPGKPRPQGEVVLGQIAQQFWAGAIQSGSVGPAAQRRFVERFVDYLDAVVQEAADREHDVHRSADSYLALRRETAGPRPIFALMLRELPDKVCTDPRVAEMLLCAMDMLIIDNDTISYNLEQRDGDVCHNLVSVTMREHACSLDAALERLAGDHAALGTRFCAHMRTSRPAGTLGRTSRCTRPSAT